MKKAIFFVIAIILVSFLSSCAVQEEQCPGVAKVELSVFTA